MKVTIYNAITFQPVTTITNADSVDFIKWSPDSKLLMCLLLRRKLVHVWSPEDVSWKCRISEGPLGLIGACWSPDSRHILTTADFQIRTTVWSLTNKSVLYLKHAKLALSEQSFSQSGDYLAVVERNDAKDSISIIRCSSWALELSFESATKDLAGLAWAPNADTFCVWESPRIAFQLCLYNTAGIRLATCCRSEEIIGIKSLLWSRCGQMLVLEGFEGKLTMLETVAWGSVFDYVLPESLEDDSVLVFREVKSKQTIGKETVDSHYEVLSARPVSLEALGRPSSVDVPAHPTAVQLSASQCYVACISAAFPALVSILDVRQLTLAAILGHLAPITCMAWDPQCERLAICTGSQHIRLWSPSEAHVLKVPAKEGPFPVQWCQWNPRRKSLLVHGQGMAALCSHLG